MIQDTLLARAVAEDEALTGPITLSFRPPADSKGSAGQFTASEPTHTELMFPGVLIPLSLSEQRKALVADRGQGGALIVGGYELHIRQGAECLTPGKEHLRYGEDSTELSVDPKPILLEMDDGVSNETMNLSGQVKGYDPSGPLDGVYAYNVLVS